MLVGAVSVLDGCETRQGRSGVPIGTDERAAQTHVCVIHVTAGDQPTTERDPGLLNTRARPLCTNRPYFSTKCGGCGCGDLTRGSL